jgi:hypothetical protein
MKSVTEELVKILTPLSDHMASATLIDARGHGWKSANLRLRKATLEAEKALKVLRKDSMDLER